MNPSTVSSRATSSWKHSLSSNPCTKTRPRLTLPAPPPLSPPNLSPPAPNGRCGWGSKRCMPCALVGITNTNAPSSGRTDTARVCRGCTPTTASTTTRRWPPTSERTSSPHTKPLRVLGRDPAVVFAVSTGPSLFERSRSWGWRPRAPIWTSYSSSQCGVWRSRSRAKLPPWICLGSTVPCATSPNAAFPTTPPPPPQSTPCSPRTGPPRLPELAPLPHESDRHPPSPQQQPAQSPRHQAQSPRHQALSPRRRPRHWPTHDTPRSSKACPHCRPKPLSEPPLPLNEQPDATTLYIIYRHYQQDPIARWCSCLGRVSCNCRHATT
mmetsp:Transcript_21274/g.46301  ORF Transcript_21274/g.46301 Transcript_21274/m.46301 type:complete len:324 (+) Transcript_21274:150-1121(+)